MISLRKLALAGAALALAGVAATALAQPKATFDNPVEPKMTPRLNIGKLNYGHYCASCHGVTARGTDKGPTFIHRVYHPGHHGDGAFFTAPRRGARAHHWGFGDMKPVPGIKDKQLAAIVDYIRAVQKANGLF